MIEASIATAIRARLSQALAPPCARYRPLRVGTSDVGWLDDSRAARLARFGDVLSVQANVIEFIAGIGTPAARTEALDRIAAVLASEGALTAWRNERYAVSAGFNTTPLFLIERAAARYFGIMTYAAHVNGLVGDGLGVDGSRVAAFSSEDSTRGLDKMWLARRSPHKSIDPGLLDNLIGGGIAARLGVRETVIKEAWEEAGIASPLAEQARPAGAVHICRAQPDGLQRETIFVHDLWLPRDRVPKGQDGEVVEHRLVTLGEAAMLIANSAGDGVVTADASLVIVDCLLRHGAITPDASDYLALEALRHSRMQPC